MNLTPCRSSALCLFVLATTNALAAEPAKSNPSAAQSAAQATPRVAENYGKLPLSFEPNQGQTDPQVKFLSRGSGYSLFLTPTEAVLALQKTAPAKRDKAGLSKSSGSILTMKLVGGNPAAKITGGDQQPGKSNYFIGNDPTKWHTNISNYGKVEYTNIYPGIDLVYYGNQRQLEFDLVVQPGADPKAVALDFRGIIDGKHAALRINDKGDLVAGATGSEVIFHKPLIYQPTTHYEAGVPHQGVEGLIDGKFVLAGAHQVRFQIAAYDKTKPLVIDPTLVYSTYLGNASGEAIAVDASGDAYITGIAGPDFPTTPGAYRTTFPFKADSSAFITKLNAAGSALIYSTFLGGGGANTFGLGIVVDASGSAYVTGETTSPHFPTTPGALQRIFGGNPMFGRGDAFVSKLNPHGTGLLYSTYLGGGNSAGTVFEIAGVTGNAIAVDASGNAYVTGDTFLGNFPTTPGAFQTTSGGETDAFVSKLNAAGTALVYSTLLGGNFSEDSRGIAVDASGNAYVTGSTNSANFPTTPGAFQTTFPGVSADFGPPDGFISKLNAAGSALLYSTFLGAKTDAFGIAVDASGNAYVTGVTVPNFPTTPGAFQTTFGGGTGDAFVSKLNAAGSALVYSTYLGGSGEDAGFSIAIDAAGNAYVAGQAGTDFPTTAGAFLAPSGAAFVGKLNPAGSALLYSTYLGGSTFDAARGIAADAAGGVYVTGSGGPDFPVTPGALQPASTFGGAFIAKLSDSVNTASADLSISNAVTSHTVLAGGTIDYAITLENSGPDVASTVRIIDVLPPQTTFVSCTSDAGGTCANNGNTVVISFPSLASVHSAFITLVAQVGATVPGGTTISNTASIASSVPDPNPGNNSSTATTFVRLTSDLSIQNAIVIRAPPGDISYMITVIAPSPVTGVVVTDPVPSGTTFVSASTTKGRCANPPVGAGGTITCTLGNGPSSFDTTTLGSIFVTVKATAPTGTTISNTATVSAATYDPNLANNSSTVTTTVAPPATCPDGTPLSRVLIAGGFGNGPNTQAHYLSNAEIYDEKTGLFMPTGSLAEARLGHTATLLGDSTVLIAGGLHPETEFSVDSAAVTSVERYDPNAGVFNPTGSMKIARANHTAALLQNGLVLVSGGITGPNTRVTVVSSAELYDPSSGTFSLTGSMHDARENFTATVLTNGKVLVAGGVNIAFLSTAELYDPATGLFTPTGSMSISRSGHTATLLEDGTVLIAGGGTGTGGFSVASAEVYDPVSGSFTVVGNMHEPENLAAANLLRNGTVLITGNAAEIYNPQTRTFFETSRPPMPGPTASLLKDGKVLVTGINSGAIYDPCTSVFSLTGPLPVSIYGAAPTSTTLTH